jgi:hypothetical protein
LTECYRDGIGHLEVPPERPGLFESLETRPIDVILMDNLHDTHGVMLHKRPNGTEPVYSMPFSMSHCENEDELKQQFYYDSPLEAEASVSNWLRIVRFVQSCQPRARIIFYCAHACTSIDRPAQYERIRAFHSLFVPAAADLGIDVMAPFDLPAELTRMPEDRDHFDMKVYRAMAGHIMLSHEVGLDVRPMTTQRA